ncbi:MAG: ribonuclease J [Acidimicrobiia bacterium]
MAEPVTITFLGGLGEIGRNCAAIEIDQRIMLLDCGLMFPEADMPGVDLVLPDFTYLLERKDRIEGCILTHGHEDHVGGLSFLLRELSFPIIGSALALGLARSRIEEARLLHRTELIAVNDGERRQFGPFDCEFIPVTHSVPHGFATAFHTPQGTILHSGDFKLDLNPVDGRRTDLATIGAIARHEGIRLLLSDSTNACERGHSRSESTVGKVLYDLFHASGGRRVITACFASHIHRVQQIADAAIAFNRVIATLGRSMQRNVSMARDMGLLRIPADRLIDIADIGDRAPGEVCIISTGSQGEPMSALSLMAAGESRWLKLTTNDTVILSSHPIPGNETSVTKVLDRLARQGVQVIHSGIEDVHATGHAKAEELKTLLSIAEPEWFTPVHGEYRHLAAHAELAREMGVPADRTILCEDGDQLVITDDWIARGPSAPAGYLYVDGSGVGDVGQGVLRDRRVLAAEGIVVVLATVDVAAGSLIGEPEVITKGWVHEPSSAALIAGCTAAVAEALRTMSTGGGRADTDALHKTVRRAAGAYVSDRTGRRPMIVPVVIEV